MLSSTALILLLACLGTSAPTPPSIFPTRPHPPQWRSWQPSRGAWKSPHDGTPSVEPAEVLMQQIQANYSRTVGERIQSLDGECTESNALVRREWGTLTADDRQAYISAIECLASLPGKTSADFAPGAKSRWDDFSVAHIINTPTVHFSAWLLPWHRHFIWEMEQALRNECNYNAALPYWDWSKYIDLPLNQNPVFDGSATSLSGNGTRSSQNCSIIDEGPLKNWTANLGPVAQADGSCNLNPRMDGLGYNARPVERTFLEPNVENFQMTNRVENLTDVILHYADAASMNLRIDNGTLGLHGPPHLYVGGLESDTYASPGDPVFYLHHAMLDRVWTLWQSQDFDKREQDVGYTNAFDASIRAPVFNWAPAPYVDLESTLYLSPWFENSTLGESMSTVKNKYCYVYE